jgi:hypothetical protein
LSGWERSYAVTTSRIVVREPSRRRMEGVEGEGRADRVERWCARKRAASVRVVKEMGVLPSPTRLTLPPSKSKPRELQVRGEVRWRRRLGDEQKKDERPENVIGEGTVEDEDSGNAELLDERVRLRLGVQDGVVGRSEGGGGLQREQRKKGRKEG